MDTTQDPCKAQTVHREVTDGEFAIWKKAAAAIVCGSTSHCSTKSFYLHISFLHVGKANITKLCCSTKGFCRYSMLQFLVRNTVGLGGGNAGESAERE